MSKYEIFFIIISAVFVIGLHLLNYLAIFKHRGFVKPDDPSDKNHPVITGGADASALKIVDESKLSDSKKDK